MGLGCSCGVFWEKSVELTAVGRQARWLAGLGGEKPCRPESHRQVQVSVSRMIGR